MNQVDYLDDVEITVMVIKQKKKNLEIPPKIKRNVLGDRGYTTQKKWDDPILHGLA